MRSTLTSDFQRTVKAFRLTVLAGPVSFSCRWTQSKHRIVASGKMDLGVKRPPAPLLLKVFKSEGRFRVYVIWMVCVCGRSQRMFRSDELFFPPPGLIKSSPIRRGPCAEFCSSIGGRETKRSFSPSLSSRVVSQVLRRLCWGSFK